MSDCVDPKLVEAACMADLSRMRQEELPLNNEAKNGPSFRPQGKNGTAHVPKKLKQNLVNNWSVQIDDEESRQVAGLTVHDARPWAKSFADHLIQKGRIERLSVEQPNAPNRAQPARGRVSRPVQTQGKTLRPAVASPVIAKTTAASQQAGTPKLEFHLVGQDEGRFSDGQGSVMIHGYLKMAINNPTSDHFVVSFKGTVFETKATIGFFLEGKGSQVHDILDFEVPGIEGDACVLRLKPKGQTTVYFTWLSDYSDTTRFCEYMVMLQQAAADLVGSAQGGVTSASALESSSSGAMAPAIAMPGEATSEEKEDLLIDMSDWHHVPNATIDLKVVQEATESLSMLVQQIVAKLGAQSHISQAIQDGVTESVLEHWSKEALNGDIDEKTKSFVVTMVGAALGLQSHLLMKAVPNIDDEPLVPTPANQWPPAMSTEATRAQEAGRHDYRIKYSAEQIEDLRHKATPRYMEINPMEFSAKRAKPGAKNKVAPKPGSKSDTIGHRFCVGISQLDEDHDTAIGNTEYARPTQQLPFTGVAAALTPGSKGLAHSRWATNMNDSSFKRNVPLDSAAPLDCSNVVPAEAPANAAKLKPGVKGLSSSRFASGETVKFAGYFTGA